MNYGTVDLRSCFCKVLQQLSIRQVVAKKYRLKIIQRLQLLVSNYQVQL